ncbi:MAG TPA: EBSC protein, partial [Tyzzerella sp.]|nr:EBSC protein [Tyzzerella sp.]
PARITKTLCLMSKEGPIVICVAGDTKIDNRKFKDTFGLKAKMLSPEETLEATGHAVGGVCPFALPEGTKAYADISMKRFDTVFPAAGSSNSAIELTCDELYHYGNCVEWVDICKGWQEEA